MKTFLALSAVGAAAFLFTGCIATDDGGGGYGYRRGGYYDDGPRYRSRADVVIYDDHRDRAHYDHDRGYDRRYDRDYNRRNVNRTNVYERNVYRTNVQRNDVNVTRNRQASNIQRSTTVQRGSVKAETQAPVVKARKKHSKEEKDRQ